MIFLFSKNCTTQKFFIFQKISIFQKNFSFQKLFKFFNNKLNFPLFSMISWQTIPFSFVYHDFLKLCFTLWHNVTSKLFLGLRELCSQSKISLFLDKPAGNSVTQRTLICTLTENWTSLRVKKSYPWYLVCYWFPLTLVFLCQVCSKLQIWVFMPPASEKYTYNEFYQQ